MKNKVKAYRGLRELTQQQLAEKIGVSRQSVIAIEKGKYMPSTLLAMKISVVLDKSIEELFMLESEDWDGA